MSLTGNLEDLPLLDILQIVSFSKKTGHLAIRATAGDGAIVFRDGLVVSAFTWDTTPLDPRAASLTPDKRERLLTNRIELALEQLIRLREGQFNFSLSDDPPMRIEGRDVTPETLDTGINPQELLLDLARGMDEDRRNSTALLEASFAEAPDEPAPLAVPPEGFEEEFELQPDDEVEDELPAATQPLPKITWTPASARAEPAPPPPAAPPPAAAAPPAPAPEPAPAEPPALLLVDDEEDVRRVLAEHLTHGGYQVVEADGPDAAVKKAGRLGKAGIPFVLMTDLGMPTSGGSSFQGGFEVVKRLLKMNLRPPVLMMTDTLSGAVQARARQLGVESFVFKPGLSKLDPEQFEADLRVFAHKVREDILPKLVKPSEPKPAAKPKREEPSPAPAHAPADATELSHEFLELQSRLRELHRRGEAGDIAGLVMKVAREFFERGVLFLVKDDEARGLAGFGAAPKGESLNLLARRIVIPLQEASAFGGVAASRKPFRGHAPDEDKGVQHLLGKMGRFKSSAVALLPLLTHRETIALLFGDNPESGAPLPRLEPLEVFINQAGIALENAFLQRKVLALSGQHVG